MTHLYVSIFMSIHLLKYTCRWRLLIASWSWVGRSVRGLVRLSTWRDMYIRGQYLLLKCSIFMMRWKFWVHLYVMLYVNMYSLIYVYSYILVILIHIYPHTNIFMICRVNQDSFRRRFVCYLRWNVTVLWVSKGHFTMKEPSVRMSIYFYTCENIHICIHIWARISIHV
jgi:hypothetical protein